MDERETDAEVVGDGGRAFGTAGVRGHDDAAFLPTVGGHDLVFDVFREEVSAVEVVDGNVEKALVLGIVQVHCYDVVCASAGEEVGDEGTGLGDPLFVAALRGESWRLRLLF